MSIKKLFAYTALTLFVIPVGLLSYPVGYYTLDDSYQASTTRENYRIKKDSVGAYLINLDRSKERYNYIAKNLKKLGIKFERISAVDGSTFSKSKIDEVVDFKSYEQFLGHTPKLGTIGCALSHYQVWQTFLNSDLEYAVVFEDDVSFDPIKLKSAIDQIIAIPNYWDIAGFELSHNGTPLAIKPLKDGHQLSTYLTEITHTGAYIINRKAARNLLSKALPIKMPVDHYFTRTWELDLKFTGVENPRLVYQTFGDSEIDQSQKSIGSNKIIKINIHRAMFKLQSYVIRFCYNLKQYFENK